MRSMVEGAATRAVLTAQPLIRPSGTFSRRGRRRDCEIASGYRAVRNFDQSVKERLACGSVFPGKSRTTSTGWD